jgi:hypothetical protein
MGTLWWTILELFLTSAIKPKPCLVVRVTAMLGRRICGHGERGPHFCDLARLYTHWYDSIRDRDQIQKSPP